MRTLSARSSLVQLRELLLTLSLTIEWVYPSFPLNIRWYTANHGLVHLPPIRSIYSSKHPFSLSILGRSPTPFDPIILEKQIPASSCLGNTRSTLCMVCFQRFTNAVFMFNSGICCAYMVQLVKKTVLEEEKLSLIMKESTEKGLKMRGLSSITGWVFPSESWWLKYNKFVHFSAMIV